MANSDPSSEVTNAPQNDSTEAINLNKKRLLANPKLEKPCAEANPLYSLTGLQDPGSRILFSKATFHGVVTGCLPSTNTSNPISRVEAGGREAFKLNPSELMGGKLCQPQFLEGGRPWHSTGFSHAVLQASVLSSSSRKQCHATLASEGTCTSSSPRKLRQVMHRTFYSRYHNWNRLI